MWIYIVVGISIAFVLLLCLLLAIANFSFENYNQNLNNLDKKNNSYGITTLQYVSMVNQKHFNNSLRLFKCEQYKDSYSSGKIALSQQTMSSNSLASLAIVSHELGHARQDANSQKLKQHWRLCKIGRFVGMFFLPLMFVGIILSFLNVFAVLESQVYLISGLTCLGAGFLIFLFAIILKYREIKIEKEASKLALDFLREILQEEEIKECQEFLNSARLTYWASLFKTMFGWTFLTKKDKMFR